MAASLIGSGLAEHMVVTQFFPVVGGKEDDGVVVNSLLLQRQNQPPYLVVQMGDARVVAHLGLPDQLRVDGAGLGIIDPPVPLQQLVGLPGAHIGGPQGFIPV